MRGASRFRIRAADRDSPAYASSSIVGRKVQRPKWHRPHRDSPGVGSRTTPMKEDLAFFPGAQVQMTIPERLADVMQ